jgi:hypothetical protein
VRRQEIFGTEATLALLAVVLLPVLLRGRFRTRHDGRRGGSKPHA